MSLKGGCYDSGGQECRPAWLGGKKTNETHSFSISVLNDGIIFF